MSGLSVKQKLLSSFWSTFVESFLDLFLCVHANSTHLWRPYTWVWSISYLYHSASKIYKCILSCWFCNKRMRSKPGIYGIIVSRIGLASGRLILCLLKCIIIVCSEFHVHMYLLPPWLQYTWLLVHRYCLQFYTSHQIALNSGQSQRSCDYITKSHDLIQVTYSL